MAGKGSGSAGLWKNEWVWIGIIGVLVTAALALVAHHSLKTRSLSKADAVAIVGLTGAVAVGIERVIEVMWTFLDQATSSWVLLRPVRTRVIDAQKMMNDQLTVYSKKLETLTEREKQSVAAVQTHWQSTIELWGKVKSNQDLLAVSSQTIADMDYVEQRLGRAAHDIGLGEIRQTLDITLNGLTDFVGSFTDNPARRVVSIFVGMWLGLVAASFIGLDGIDAALGKAMVPWGVVATGLLVGLGSNPTHEVIKALQEFKKNQRSEALKGAPSAGSGNPT